MSETITSESELAERNKRLEAARVKLTQAYGDLQPEYRNETNPELRLEIELAMDQCAISVGRINKVIQARTAEVLGDFDLNPIVPVKDLVEIRDRENPKLSSELNVYGVGGEEWWIATSEAHAIEQACELSGIPSEDYGDDVSIMTDEQLERFQYHDNDTDETVSGLEQVRRLKERGEWGAGPFAFSE